MITFHEFCIFLSCVTHACKTKMCVFKSDRGKRIQRTCTAISPSTSSAASEVTSSLCFHLRHCLLEDTGFSFCFVACPGLFRNVISDKKKGGGGGKKSSPLKFRLCHFLKAARKWWYLKLSDASSQIPHCYVMYYHSNSSLHWYSTPHGQAALCQHCRFSDDARNTEQLNSKWLKQCFPSDHTKSQKERIPKLWQEKGRMEWEELAALGVGGKWVWWKTINKAGRQHLMLDFLKERTAQHHCVVENDFTNPATDTLPLPVLCLQFCSR